MFRIGHGFDVHPLTKDRKLILGGVQIDHESGLAGHSDADVVIHALMDSILGAMGKGDIGMHFPDTDPKYKDISSIDLLKQVHLLMKKNEFVLVNADLTVHAEVPKIAPFVDKMRANIASTIDCDIAKINIKATTWEKLGFVGREEGIAADAVVLISKSKSNPHSETKEKTKKPLVLFDDDTPIERRIKTKGEIIVYTDGASRGNPGPSAAGAVIEDADGKSLQEISMFLGEMTNNQAEYQALILALKDVVSMRPEHVTIRMDSELIVKQIKGEYKIKNEKLIPLASIVKQQLMLLNSWRIEHVPREKNEKADHLANQALDNA